MNFILKNKNIIIIDCFFKPAILKYSKIINFYDYFINSIKITYNYN